VVVKMKWIVVVAAVAFVAACVSGANIRFKDKVVLVTGGTSGIGYQTALQFAQEGARVIICARDKNPTHYSGKRAVAAIQADATVKANGGTVRFIQADVSKEQDTKNMFEDIFANEGAIDIAVNNAGISGPLGKLGDTAEFTGGEHDPIVNNLYGAIRCISYEEANMVNYSTNGTIINVVGIEGITPNSTLPRYAAASHAIIGLGKGVALQHITGLDGPYIRCNIVCPARTATPFAFNMVKPGKQPWEGDWITEDSKEWEEALPGLVEHIPMGRVARPNEVANTILWLCTEDAIHISGDVITVDGGFWAD